LSAPDPNGTLRPEPSFGRQALELYGEAVSVARSLYSALQNPSKASPQPAPVAVLEKIVRALKDNRPELLVLTERSTPDNYLYAHAVNVCILSVGLAIHRGVSESDLLPLALGAFLHDIGMGTYLPLITKKGRLSDDEKKRLQLYPKDSQRLLSFFPDLKGPAQELVSQIVGQTHERADGKGYPDRKQSEDIHPLARLVGLCDVYEAVTHPRPWRPRTLPHDALRIMIEEQEALFEPGLVRSLIELLSLYPPGSFIRLNSGEVGRVVQAFPGLPSRPKVKLMADGKGARLNPPVYANLAAQPAHYVSAPVDETTLDTPDPRLRLELRAQRWWIKGM
jgi:HD-GYP domain-containing protein (c-di-GMP phosphodiesterase class II)